MRSSYKKEDVTLLLKDITGMVEPQSTKEREQLIQSGRHYCEMLPIEYVPSEKYMEAYEEALRNFSHWTAQAVGSLADRIIEKRGEKIVLVSLARAGIPIGIMLKHYLKWKYKIEVPHYSISIIRGKGIDKNAMNYLLERHLAENLLFVDGWTGKGAILQQLREALTDYPNVPQDLAVAADPAHITELCGTYEDILIPSCCLNSTVSGLISRTFLRDDIIGPWDFHGAVYYGELKEKDLSYPFIEAIEAHFTMENPVPQKNSAHDGMQEVAQIGEAFAIKDRNLIKPGIGETTRVLLRRVPWKVLISETCKDDPALEHIRRLAAEKGTEIMYYPLNNYKCCGLIKKLADT